MIYHPGASLRETLQRSATRRQVLRVGGLIVGLAAASSLVAACSSAAEAPTAVPTTASPPTPPPAPTRPPVAAATVAPTPPPAPTAPPVPTIAGAATPVASAATPTAAAAGSAAGNGIASTMTIQAKESGSSFLYDVDNLVVAAGTVKVTFKNVGKQTHELWLYPVQDVSKLVNLKRAGQDATEDQFLKGVAGQSGEVQPGKSATFDAKLAPGFYELACYMVSGDANGTMFPHYDRGQTVTIAAVGAAGGPAPSVNNAASTMNVQMVQGQNDLASSWLFVPDRLVVKPGDVVFSVTNKLTESHDFTVYPLGDVSSYVVSRFKGDDPDVGTVIKGAQELLANAPAGQTQQKMKTLTAGMWAAACFMVSKDPDGTSFMHRDRGQRFSFLVKG
jgi:plastocyanin